MKRRKPVILKYASPNHNPDDNNDSDIESSPEDHNALQIKCTSSEIDYESIMRFPADTEQGLRKELTKEKTKTKRTGFNDYDEEFFRGMYMGKDRGKKNTGHRNDGCMVDDRSKGIFVPDPKKQPPPLEFDSNTRMGCISWILRAREMKQKGWGLLDANGTGAADDAIAIFGNRAGSAAGDNKTTATPRVATGGKRKRTRCADPRRIKRTYVWKSGGKRAREGVIQKKIRERMEKDSQSEAVDGEDINHDISDDDVVDA